MKQLKKVLLAGLILSRFFSFSQDCSGFNVSLGGGSVCSAASFTLTPVVTGENGFVNYEWNTGETSSFLHLSPGITGTYELIVIDSLGCKDTAAATVTQKPDLTVVIPGPVDLCFGEDTLITSNYQSVDGYSFAWTDEINQIGNSESITVYESGTYSIYVEGGGCSGSTSVNVVVNNLPSVSVNSSSICQGDIGAIFTATSSTPVSSYVWSENGTGSAQTTVGTIAGNYTVVVSDMNGCRATVTGVLTVEPLPIVGNALGTICEGDDDTVGEVIPTGGTYSYLWGSNANNATTAIYTVTQGGNYVRTVTSVAGCISTSTYVVTENGDPSITINDEEECTGDLMTMSDTDPTGTNGFTYIWNPGSWNGPSINPTSNQVYDITKINDVTGCFSTITASARFVGVPHVSIEADTVTICQGESAELFVTHDAASIIWSNGLSTDYIQVVTQGVYSVYASNGGCPAKDSVYVQVLAYGEVNSNSTTCQVSNSVNLLSKYQVIVYPNPVSEGNVIVQANEVPVSISVTDANGSLAGSYVNTNNFNVSVLSAGIYIVQIRFSNGITTEKLVVR
ncbi:MAG: hypothetical protein ACJAZ2_000146 [Glaciecola sp.]|jgi:hypothetical protein